MRENPIKKKRIELNLTREVVAKHVGVSTTALQMWEIGRYQPSTANYIKLAQILEADMASLFEDYDKWFSENIKQGEY